jgi:ubiquinone/menaquinone biosynthesis C-methylase UbiE
MTAVEPCDGKAAINRAVQTLRALRKSVRVSHLPRFVLDPRAVVVKVVAMNRTVEPELMTEESQALAYARADFESAHSSYPKLFAEKFPHRPKKALALDLGCGPCDVTIRFAKAHPGWKFHAVDGSAAMLKQARPAIARQRCLASRIKLIEGFIPGARIPRRTYDVILASSFLHHLHDPQVLWKAVRRFSRRGTIVFIADLRRPASRSQARTFERRYSRGEPKVLRRDFFNSLLAAFTPTEIREQLKEAGLTRLRVEIVSDRHLVVFGRTE